MPEIDPEHWKNELISGGFRPQRYGFIVRQVRRALWPLIRPFHFYTIDTFSKAYAELQAAVDQRQNGGTEIFGEMREELHNEIARRNRDAEIVAGTTAILQSDLVAVVHRQLAIENDLSNLSNQLAQVADERAQTADRQIALKSEMRRITSQLERFPDESGAEPSLLERVGRIDRLTKLFLTHAKHGLFIVKSGEVISDTVVSTGEWDAHIISMLDEASVRGGTAVDVGAHFGLLSIPMARRFARVVSVEPNEFNFAILSANVALNALSNVQCMRSAMFSRETVLSLAPDEAQEVAIPRTSSGEPAWLECSNLGALVFSVEPGAVRTPARTLDSLAIADLVFLKIDAQGADGEVIAGAINTIRRCRPIVVFEWENALSRNFSVSFEDASKLLLEAGYEIEVLKRHNEKQVDYIARPARPVDDPHASAASRPAA